MVITDLLQISLRNIKGGHVGSMEWYPLNKTGFHLACTYGREEIVAMMIEKSDELNIDLTVQDFDNNTPFHLACRQGQLRIVEILIKNSELLKIDFNQGTAVYCSI